MAITVRDIAKHTKTSVATVSRVLNGSDVVKRETKELINKAVIELGYVPPQFTKILTNNYIKTIGLLTSDLENLYYPAVIRGIQDELDKVNHHLFLCSTDNNIAKEKKYISDLLNKGVQGFIFLGTRNLKADNRHIVKLSNSYPVCMVNDYVLGSNIFSVMIDETEGAYKAIEYLINLGHRSIVFINGNTRASTFKYKLDGYVKALEAHNIAYDKSKVIYVNPYEDGGFVAGKTILKLEQQPSAIFAASDQIVLGLLRAFYEAGKHVPNDYSIVGFSDIPIAQQYYPPLNTINQFPYETGQTVTRTLLKLIQGETIHQKRILLEPKLTIRESCKSIERSKSYESIGL